MTPIQYLVSFLPSTSGRCEAQELPDPCLVVTDAAVAFRWHLKYNRINWHLGLDVYATNL